MDGPGPDRYTGIMQPTDHADQFVRRFAPVWLGAAVAGTLLGLGTARALPPTYQGVVTATFATNSPLQQETTPFYLYDSYYALLAANREKSNYLAWLGEPATVQATFAAAGLTAPTGSAAELAKTFAAVTTEQANSATIAVSRPSEAEARSLAEAVKTASLAFPTAQHGLLFSDVSVQALRPSLLLVTLGVALTVLALTFLATFALDRFAPRPAQQAD